MRSTADLTRDLVLVGGGHSHALVLRMLAMDPIEGLRTTLISPSSHTPYSGMLPGLIAGHYRFEDVHIDLSRLCQWAQVRFVADEVIGIDPKQKRLLLAGRPPIEYDLTSLDIGSRPELDSVPGARENAIPVKPIAHLWRRWRQRLDRTTEVDGKRRIAVVGGGAGGVELVLAIAHCLRGKCAELQLFCAASQILPHSNARSRRAAMVALDRLGVRVHLSARVTLIEPSRLFTQRDEHHDYDDLFWCTGAAAPQWIASSGLATDDRGFLAVHNTLQVVNDDSIFAAGDIAAMIDHPRPKAGVYAVRQAPVLAHNLRAALLERPLRPYRPQRRFLSLLSLGRKIAIADRGAFCAHGPWVWRWKDRIDRSFMARFEQLPSRMPGIGADALSDDPALQQMVCGGCAAKVGADALSDVLQQVASDHPEYCVGGVEDAAVVPAPANAVIVQSVDMLRALVSDPWQMGRIAANHALSDLYACGARPVSALAAVTLPFADAPLLRRELRQLLDGAVQVFAAAACPLRGGHSMQGEEMSIGFVVNGVSSSADGRLLQKSGAQAGDVLVVTKPLGTGVLFAAHMQLAADGRDVHAAIESMLQSNRLASQLALAHGSHACTDITGFGLLGHLLEMLGDDLGARLELGKLPLLGGVLDHLRSGIVSTMQSVNQRSASRALQQPSEVEQPLAQVLFDPQTSGGLLIALPASRAPALVLALQQAGFAAACSIGEVRALSSAEQVVVFAS
ncbi:MAG: selenide, water dikinase SelD [Halioglobus sp.]|nr:selenide, water dikinase SelD [Halioglobus sp.]